MKKRIQKAMIAAGSAVSTTLVSAGSVSAQIIPVDAPQDAGYFTDFNQLMTQALTIVMALAAILVLFYLVWGGIDWITSGGDKGKTESARNKITAAVIGLIIVAASYAIFRLILGFLGADLGTLNNAFDRTGTP